MYVWKTVPFPGNSLIHLLLKWQLYFFLGCDASVVVNPDKEDDSIVYVENRGNLKRIEVDRVFGPGSTQQEVSSLCAIC